MAFDINKEIKFLEETKENIKKIGSPGSLISLTPIVFNFLFKVVLFLLKKEKERMQV